MQTSADSRYRLLFSLITRFAGTPKHFLSLILMLVAEGVDGDLGRAEQPHFRLLIGAVLRLKSNLWDLLESVAVSVLILHSLAHVFI